jgi:CopG family transcriptional regulator/antitoxin EndoAI
LAESRKILISLPESLLKEVDSIVNMEKTNRSEFVRRTIQLYIRERRKIEVRDRLKKGYQEMAEINIKLSEIWFNVDNDLQLRYEKRLGGLD